MKKSWIVALLIALTMGGTLVGCGGEVPPEGDKVFVLTANPYGAGVQLYEYDMVKNAFEAAEVEIYQPGHKYGLKMTYTLNRDIAAGTGVQFCLLDRTPGVSYWQPLSDEFDLTVDGKQDGTSSTELKAGVKYSIDVTLMVKEWASAPLAEDKEANCFVFQTGNQADEDMGNLIITCSEFSFAKK